MNDEDAVIISAQTQIFLQFSVCEATLAAWDCLDDAEYSAFCAISDLGLQEKLLAVRQLHCTHPYSLSA